MLQASFSNGCFRCVSYSASCGASLSRAANDRCASYHVTLVEILQDMLDGNERMMLGGILDYLHNSPAVPCKFMWFSAAHLQCKHSLVCMSLKEEEAQGGNEGVAKTNTRDWKDDCFDQGDIFRNLIQWTPACSQFGTCGFTYSFIYFPRFLLCLNIFGFFPPRIVHTFAVEGQETKHPPHNWLISGGKVGQTCFHSRSSLGILYVRSIVLTQI